MIVANDHIKLRHIRCFLDIVETGSARASAEKLCITESAISKTVKELEADLGVQLFNRSRRGMSPTESGLRFARYARNAVDALSLGIEDLSKAGGAAREVYVGSMPSMAGAILPAAVDELLRSHDDKIIQIVAGDYRDLLDKLRKGMIEFILGRMPIVNDITGLSFERLGTDKLVFVARPGHPLLSGQPLDLSQLAGFPWTLPPGDSVSREELRRSLAASRGGMSNQRVETHYFHLSLSLVLRTNAIWVVSNAAVAELLASGVVVRLAVEAAMLEAPIGLLTMPDRGLSPLALELVAKIKVLCAKLDDSVAHVPAIPR